MQGRSGGALELCRFVRAFCSVPIRVMAFGGFWSQVVSKVAQARRGSKSQYRGDDLLITDYRQRLSIRMVDESASRVRAFQIRSTAPFLLAAQSASSAPPIARSFTS